MLLAVATPLPLLLPPQPTVIVLAAGRGERFKASGGQAHKLQALLHGQAVLDHTLAAVHASGLPWLLVTPALVRAFLLAQGASLERVSAAGMGDSIAAGVSAAVSAAPHTTNTTGWLILPGDLPSVQVSTLQAVAQALQQHAQVAPRHLGQRGHPVGFVSAYSAALVRLRGEQGAGKLLDPQALHLLAVNDFGCVSDVDTVADLQRLEAQSTPRLA
jgi:molybdenum cofactor cytidylyltransferase